MISSDTLQDFYQKRKAKFESEFSAVSKRINAISNFRLFTAALFFGTIYLAFKTVVFIYVLPVLLIVFLLLVKRHSVLYEKKVHLQNLVKVNADELSALQGDFSCFGAGLEFIDQHHHYTHDLDIFGHGSLFQSVNRSCTLNGAAALAASFASPTLSTAQIEDRQQAVKELSAKPEFRQHFKATGMNIDELVTDRQQLLTWAVQKPFLYGKKFMSWFLKVFPAITVGLLLVSFFVDGISMYVSACAIVQWMVLGVYMKRVNAFHSYVSKRKNVVSKYARLLKLSGDEKFESPVMMKFGKVGLDGAAKVKSLASLVTSLDARLNFMTNVAVNSVLLYDLQCIYRLEKWKEDNAAELQQWIDIIGEIDLLCSLGTFNFNNPDFNFPTITTDQKIQSEAMGHPLIAARERVNNDITINNTKKIMIITGANMAGKSTFLRTLGINIVLALSGAPVCARTFVCPVIKMRTGMRTADSLQDHQSYFYAELDRLKSIVDELRAGTPMLILLDEILKGTNSTDKQAGSIALVKQLLAYQCLGLIATHDLALGDLEKEYPDLVRNFSFEPTIEADQLTFDYKMRTGLAKTMNATFLMKKMGIIPS